MEYSQAFDVLVDIGTEMLIRCEHYQGPTRGTKWSMPFESAVANDLRSHL